jgi:hypothetical protein
MIGTIMSLLVLKRQQKIQQLRTMIQQSKIESANKTILSRKERREQQRMKWQADNNSPVVKKEEGPHYSFQNKLRALN